MKKGMVVAGLILLGIAGVLVALVGIAVAIAVVFVGLMLFIALVGKGVRMFGGEDSWEEEDDGVWRARKRRLGRRRKRRQMRRDGWFRSLYLPNKRLADFSVPRELYDFRIGGGRKEKDEEDE